MGPPKGKILETDTVYQNRLKKLKQIVLGIYESPLRGFPLENSILGLAEPYIGVLYNNTIE